MSDETRTQDANPLNGLPEEAIRLAADRTLRISDEHINEAASILRDVVGVLESLPDCKDGRARLERLMTVSSKLERFSEKMQQAEVGP